MSNVQPPSPFYPSGLFDTRNAADLSQVLWRNFYVINEGPGFTRQPSRVSGQPTRTSGPPTTGQHYANALWIDGLRSLWCCTLSGRPGSWVQIEVPIVSGSFPSVNTTGYRVVRSDLNYATYYWDGSSWVNTSGGGGTITGAANLGTSGDGEGVYYDVSGGLIRLYRIKGGSNVVATTNANDITLDIQGSPYFTGNTKVDSLSMKPSSAPTTPIDGSFVMWTETSGTSPSKVITWKAKSDDGVEVILASTIV